MVPLGRLHTREALHCNSQHWDFNVLTSSLWIPLSPTAEKDFQWWKSAHNVLRGDPVTPTEPDTQLFTDASNIGLGSTLECINGVRCMYNNRENTSHQRTRVTSHTQSHAPLAAEVCGSDSPGCVRQLHFSVLQAGRNTINTAVQTDQEATPHVSGQPNSTPGTTHPREIERPCRHSVTPFPDVRYRMVSTSICLPSTDTGMGNPITGSVCNEVEPQTSTTCVPCSRSISHDSRCSVNELEGTVGICIPTTISVTTGAREGPTGPVRTDPHCHTQIPLHLSLCPTRLRRTRYDRQASMEQIMRADTWRCHNTFTDFYLKDLPLYSADLIHLGPVVAAESILHPTLEIIRGNIVYIPLSIHINSAPCETTEPG